jgi:hypothetical protein
MGCYLIAERCQADDVLVIGDYVNDSQIGIHGKLFERRITSMCRQSRTQLLENHQIPHLPDAPNPPVLMLFFCVFFCFGFIFIVLFVFLFSSPEFGRRLKVDDQVV